MAGEWRVLPFSHAVLLNPGVHLERGTAYPFVDMAAVNSSTRSVQSISHREYSGGGSRFRSGDTLMARITPCLENGKIARFDPLTSESMTAAHGSTELIVLRGRPNVTDTDFVYYLTKWPEVRNYAIGQMTGTSGRQRVPTDCFDHLTIAIPPLPKQHAIAHILGTLDDKIELNRRMNETLEAMARALFKDWFVDFGPTRAKIEGRDPYLAQEMWDLFPEELDVDGKPEGWTAVGVGEVVELLDSKRIPLSSRERGKRRGLFPYHGATGVMDYVDDFLFDEILLLVGEDGSVARPNGRPFTQYVWGKIWVNNHAHVLRGVGVSVEQLKCFFDRVDIGPYVTGAVQPKLNQANLKRVQFPKGSPKLHQSLDGIIQPWFARIRLNDDEAKILAQTRDLLLPKLMSGEVRVSDVVKIVQDFT